MKTAANSIDQSKRITLGKLIRVLTIFRDLDNTMPLSEVLAFLIVVQDDSNITLDELGKRIGTSQGTAARLIQALGTKDRHKEPGLELLSSITDPTNYAKNIRSLTGKGDRLVNNICSIIDGTQYVNH